MRLAQLMALALVAAALLAAPARAEKIAIDGFEIDYGLATDSSPDPERRRLIDAYRAAWAQDGPGAMLALFADDPGCPDGPEQRRFMEEWALRAYGGAGRVWPRATRLRFHFLPWREADLLMLHKRGLAAHLRPPVSVMAVAALDPAHFAKPDPDASFQSMNFFSVARDGAGALALTAPCLTEKGRAEARSRM